MAGPCAQRSFCLNSLSSNKNELVGAIAIECSVTLTPISAVSHAHPPHSAIRITKTCARNNLQALIDNSGFCTFTLILTRAYCLFCTSVH